MAGLAGGTVVGGAPILEADAKDAKEKDKARDRAKHVGKGPKEPLYWPPEDEISIQSHTTRTYQACDRTSRDTCGYCGVKSDKACLGRYYANGRDSSGGYKCYEYFWRDSICGRKSVFGGDYCYNDHYCLRTTDWGQRCYGPAGCV